MGRDADPHSLGSNRCAGSARNLKREAVATEDGLAIPIGAMVDVWIQELFNQVSVRSVQFHAVEPGLNRVLRGYCILFDGMTNVGQSHGAGRRVWLALEGVRVHLPWANLARWTKYLGAFRKIGDVRYPSSVHQLHEDPS